MTIDKKEDKYKKVYSHTATKETIDHYKRCEKAILSLCKYGDYTCSLIGDNWRWYKVNFEEKKAKLWLASEESYEFLIQKHRTLYWTLQAWTPEIATETRTWIQKPNGKWGIDKLREGPLGTRKDTRLMTLSVDIDRAKDKEITDPNVKKWLEAALKLFADYFKSIDFQSYALFFSGGGGYVMVHPLVTAIGEDEKHDTALRWEMVQQCFDIFIFEMEKRFFEENPEAKEWIKGFDCLNYDAKRQFKMPLSIHLTKPFAVIPLDKKNPTIDFNKARLPISDEVIEETANCLGYYDGDVGRLGEHIIKVYVDKAKEAIGKRHPLNRTFKTVPDDEELDADSWAPCARNMLNESKVMGKGTTRRLAFLANYMRFVGVPREKAYSVFIKKAQEWRGETSNIFESKYDGDGDPTCWIPICANFNNDGKGYPNMAFGGMGLCTPDNRCKQIKHPLQYHKKKAEQKREERLSELCQIMESEVCADIEDTPHKVVLDDTSIDIYHDENSGDMRIRIKESSREERCILFCAKRELSINEIRDNHVFQIWSKDEPWKVESKRNHIAKRLYEYNIISLDGKNKTEKVDHAKRIVDKLYSELIPKRKIQQEALTEYFGLIEKEEGLEGEEYSTKGELEDGRFYEEIFKDGKEQFVVYDFERGSYEYEDEIDNGDGTIHPYPVDEKKRSSLMLADGVEEYGSLVDLRKDMLSFALEEFDPVENSELFELVIYLMLTTWIASERMADRIEKFIPILSARGGSETGKKRFLTVARWLTYRSMYALKTNKIPTLFRYISPWKGTMVLDEADLNDSSENSDFVEFMNSRADGVPIPRYSSGKDRVEIFYSFGMTVLAERSAAADDGYESRKIIFPSDATTKPENYSLIPPEEWEEKGKVLQRKLLLFRLRHIKGEMPSNLIIPNVESFRVRESLLLLQSLTSEDKKIGETIGMIAEKLQQRIIIERSNSIDGLIVNTIYNAVIDDEGYIKKHGVNFEMRRKHKGSNHDGADDFTTPLTLQTISKRLGEVLSSSEIARRWRGLGQGTRALGKVDKKKYTGIIQIQNLKRFRKELKKYIVEIDETALDDRLKIQETLDAGGE